MDTVRNPAQPRFPVASKVTSGFAADLDHGRGDRRHADRRTAPQPIWRRLASISNGSRPAAADLLRLSEGCCPGKRTVKTRCGRRGGSSPSLRKLQGAVAKEALAGVYRPFRDRDPHHSGRTGGIETRMGGVVSFTGCEHDDLGHAFGLRRAPRDVADPSAFCRPVARNRGISIPQSRLPGSASRSSFDWLCRVGVSRELIPHAW